MIRLMLTGAGGQLGQEMMHLAETQDGVLIFPFTHRELDVTDNLAVLKAVKEVSPHAILHAAAYTQVDLAESEEELAFRVNAIGTKNVAEAAVSHGAKLCYISTDYVFNGQTQLPYREDAKTCPLGVYGKSKELGEQYAREICPQSFVVRTAWLYGAYGPNFVHTMLRLGASEGKDGICVVHDQTGCPTWTLDLANFLICLIRSNAFGTYHACNTGVATWYEFAQAIFEFAGLSVSIMPISTSEFPRPAPRPQFSVLDGALLKDRGFEPLRPWREALQAFFQKHHGGDSR